MIDLKRDSDLSNKKDVKSWTTAPNQKMGKQIWKSVQQSIKDGGVKSVKDTNNKKNIGKTITTKKGNKTWIEEYAKIADQNKNKKKIKA